VTTYGTLATALRGIPHTTAEKGLIIHNAVLKGKFKNCLELGFASGVGSSYIAGALDANRGGRLTSVDTKEALRRKPLASETLAKLQLEKYVELVFHEISYTWFLMDAIEKGKKFDFCFLDGAHTWDVDGLAFFLVEKVLSPGGMIIFDDLDWCYATSPTMKDVPAPELFRKTAGVRKIFELLVKQHPNMTNFREEHGMGIAEKRK
jgi:predicted O-methyltransferase YrrM